jgi:copper(I)-binding protein
VRKTLAGLAAIFALALIAPAAAEDVKAGDLVITQAWTRATPNGAKIGGGYLTIENKGTTPDRLVSGTADVAGKVEVHEMSMDNGVMKMRALDKGLAIEPGKTVKLAPGGYHLMMFDLKNPLKQGDKVPVTLEFEKAGKVSVSLDVQPVGAQAPGVDQVGVEVEFLGGAVQAVGEGAEQAVRPIGISFLRVPDVTCCCLRKSSALRNAALKLFGTDYEGVTCPPRGETKKAFDAFGHG